MTSALSFHCMICFEEFDTHTIYPVVLPCGHTYVCNLCARRIDKCMECRTSLLQEIKVDTNTGMNMTVAHNSTEDLLDNSYAATVTRRRQRQYSNESRYSSHSNAHSRGHGQPGVGHPSKSPVKKERIPLPKNLVLISLIESSQLIKQSPASSANSMLKRFTQEPDQNDLEISEHSKIVFGADMANSPCGTYAVARKEGLVIRNKMDMRTILEKDRKTKPKLKAGSFDGNVLSLNTVDTSDSWESSVEDMVVRSGRKKRSFSLSHDSSSSVSVSLEDRNEIKLNCGDRVQVVSFVYQWAKLARGYGYVYCENPTDLVKVGGALDKAAHIEAMLSSLSCWRNKLIEQKDSTERDAIKLMQELQTVLINDEDVTVIGAEAFEREELHLLREDFSSSFSLNGNRGALSMLSMDDCENDNSRENTLHTRNGRAVRAVSEGSQTVADENYHDDEIAAQKKANAAAADAVKANEENNSILSNSISFLDFAFCGIQNMMDMNERRDDTERSDQMSTLQSTMPQHATPIDTSTGKVTTNAMVRAAQEWRRRNGKEASQLAHIDFRTGMSGHQGVLSHHAHAHNNNNYDQTHSNSPYQYQGSGGLPRMSDHCALTPKRKKRPKSLEQAFSLSFG